MSTQLSQVDKAAKTDKYQGHIAQINIEDFTSDSFRVDEYISQLAAPVLTGRSTERPGGVSPSVPEIKRILAYFERCEKDIVRLENQVDFKVECLRRDLAREESAYQVQVSRLEIGWDAVQEQFSDLENRITSATQAATKIGNRLQSAEQHRVRSLDAMEQLQYLQEFAHARDPSTLSQTFHQQARMAHAAAITSRLLGVANDLISSRERVGLGEAPPVPKQPGSSPQRAAAPALGSIENAVEQLELYRNVLENRVVSRFDDALARGELVTMADCADIMAEFPRGEAVLVQRYISTRPMFTRLRELQFGAGAVAAPSQGSQEQAQQAAGVAQRAGQVEAQAGAGAASTAADQQAAGMASLRGLSSLYKGILSTMRDEAVVMEQVFPSPQRALRMFIQRIFEQRVGTALSAALRPPGRDAGHAALQVHLNVLAEAYRKTQALASELQDVSGCEVVDQVEAVFSQVLNDYPAQELRWLALLYDAKLKQRTAQQALSMELVLDFLAMNEEAVSRCVVLSPAPLLAANLRQLFHSSTHKVANTGCLLEQVASHLILGLTATVEAAGKALLGPFQPASVLHKAQEPGQQGGSANPAGAAQSSGSAAGTGVQGGVQPGGAGGPGSPSPASGQLPSRSTIRQAAQLSLSGSLAAVLQAVDVVGGMALAVQRHYTRVILPHVEGSGADAKACAAGLAALIKAASDRVLAALQRMLTLLFNQVDLTLVAEQKRGDFRPGEQDPPPSFELPTPACLVVTELLEAAAQLADTHLHGANRKAFHGEMGRRLLRTLQLHMARFTYSPMGALRWKRDVSEYEACCRKSLHLPEGGALLQQMEELQNSLNLLVVPPESLLSLVDANLRMSHAAALKVIQLREDFRSVRVGGGKTLAAVFSEP